MSIGTFCLILNERQWVGAHCVQVLPYVDEMVFFDGGSTDGTLEILRAIQMKSPYGAKLRISQRNPRMDLREEYQRESNNALRAVESDWAWFLHPDMFVLNPAAIKMIGKRKDGVALLTDITSIGGDDLEHMVVINSRFPKWKNIYRRKNPDLGAHYHGFYGTKNEDVYFSQITGDDHFHHGMCFDEYPYPVEDSGIRCLHFSDVRPFSRRLSRMMACMKNQGAQKEVIEHISSIHPRVTLKPELGWDIVPFEESGLNDEYEQFVRARQIAEEYLCLKSAS